MDEHKSDPQKPSMEILAKISKQMQAGRCKEVNFQLMIDYLSDSSTPTSANDRSWYYQSKFIHFDLIVALLSRIPANCDVST